LDRNQWTGSTGMGGRFGSERVDDFTRNNQTYFHIASALYENLFGAPPTIDHTYVTHTKTGEFLALWAEFDHSFRAKLPPKVGPAYYWKRDFLATLSEEAARVWETLTLFRANLVHGLDTPQPTEIESRIGDLRRLMILIGLPSG